MWTDEELRGFHLFNSNVSACAAASDDVLAGCWIERSNRAADGALGDLSAAYSIWLELERRYDRDAFWELFGKDYPQCW